MGCNFRGLRPGNSFLVFFREVVVGLYSFENELVVHGFEVGAGGEYQLTDAIDLMRRRGGEIGYREIVGERIDVGTPERLRKANRNFDPRRDEQ